MNQLRFELCHLHMVSQLSFSADHLQMQCPAPAAATHGSASHILLLTTAAAAAAAAAGHAGVVSLLLPASPAAATAAGNGQVLDVWCVSDVGRTALQEAQQAQHKECARSVNCAYTAKSCSVCDMVACL